MKKQKLSLCLAALLVLVVAVGCGGDDDAGPDRSARPSTASTPGGTDDTEPLEPLSLTVAIGWQPPAPICCIADEAAKDFGYFDDVNLDVTFVPAVGSAVPMQTLAAGRADLVISAVVPAFSTMLATDDTDVRFVGCGFCLNLERQGIGLLFAATDDIDGPEDLEGKTIGITTGTDPTDPNYVAASALLESVGLTDDDVEWAVVGNQPQRAQALLAGRVDFTGIGAEFVGQIESTDGFHTMQLDPPASDFQGWQNGVPWWTKASVADDPKKAEAVERYVTAVMRAIRDLSDDYDFFAEVAGSFQPALAEEGEATLRPAWEYQRKQWHPNGGYNGDDIQEYLDEVFFKDLNPDKAGAFDMAQVGEPRYVKAALEALGEDTSVDHDPPQFPGE